MNRKEVEVKTILKLERNNADPSHPGPTRPDIIRYLNDSQAKAGADAEDSYATDETTDVSHVDVTVRMLQIWLLS